MVRLEASTVCFSEQDIASLRSLLLDAGSSKHALLCALRKLDCYRLELHDLQRSGIGAAVATLTAHPKPEVARFAAALLDKLRAVAEATLFPRLPYDAAAAAAAPTARPRRPRRPSPSRRGWPRPSGAGARSRRSAGPTAWRC